MQGGLAFAAAERTQPLGDLGDPGLDDRLAVYAVHGYGPRFPCSFLPTSIVFTFCDRRQFLGGSFGSI
jgi:hypothetical protein